MNAVAGGYYADSTGHGETVYAFDDGSAIYTALTKCDEDSWCSGLRDDNLTMVRDMMTMPAMIVSICVHGSPIMLCTTVTHPPCHAAIYASRLIRFRRHANRGTLAPTLMSGALVRLPVLSGESWVSTKLLPPGPTSR
jgi:hypothetical protein